MHLKELRTPCPDLQGVDAYAPFTYSGYSHGHALNVLSPEFKAVKDAVLTSDPSDDLYARSTLRDGLAIWDTAAGLPACKWRTVYERPGLAKPCRGTNKCFDSIIQELIKCGPIDKHRWRRPKGEFILDLPSYNKGFTGWDLLTAAEVMAQHEMLNVSRGPMLCGRIRLWLARLQLGLLLDLPVFDNEWDCYSAGEMLPGTGVLIATGMDAYKPTCCVPMSGLGCPVPDRTVMVVSVGQSYGKLPSGFLKGTGGFTAATRWACSPITSVIAGWLPLDHVTHMPIAQSNESYVLHYQDLEGSDSLVVGGNPVGMRVGELLSSDFYAGLYRNSHPHPLPEGLLIRNDINSGLIRPPGKLPDKLNPRSREHKAWLDYQVSLKVIRDLIVGASAAYERSRRIGAGWQGLANIKPEKRRANWNKLKRLLEQKEIYNAKRKKKQREGFLSEARTYAKKIEEIEEKVAAALAPLEKEGP